MLQNFKWLALKDEIEFEQRKFKGKLAGKANKYSQHLDGIIRTRIMIFAMSMLIFHSVLTNYLLHDSFEMEFLIERSIFSMIFMVCGILFNKARIVTIIISSLPLLLIIISYFFDNQFSGRPFAFMTGITIVLLSGVYHQIQLKKLKKELENSLIENSLLKF